MGAMSDGLREAVQAAAPADDFAAMPEDQAQRVVEGARHLSPHLGERMRAIQLFGRSIFIRELLPQDLKIELETLTREQAMNIARFLADVVGNAHARQMDEDTRSKWAKELSRARTGDLKALLLALEQRRRPACNSREGISGALSALRAERVPLAAAPIIK